jgi:EmrB/QacA subfamily drug resistance transporter
VLAAAVLASAMAFVDATVVNVALPVLQERLQAPVSAAQWVVEAYGLFLSSLLLVGGSLGDRLGRRRIFLTGVSLFAAASVFCALAGSIGQLVAARAVQGVGAAMLVPGSLALISATFPERERGRAIGAWSAFTSVATAVGPVLGGWLVERVSWRAAFWINLPFAIAVFLIGTRRVPESRDPEAPRLDLPGAALGTLGLAGLVFGLIEAPGRGWGSPWVFGALAVGVAALAAFVRVERRRRDPMLPPALFRSREFAGANHVTFFLYAALSAGMFFLPFNLIQAQGFTPAQAGAAFLPFTAILFGLSRWSGGLLDRVGPRLPLVAGPALAAAGFLLLAVPGAGASYWSGFFPGICVVGLGMAVTVAPLTTTVMNSVERRRAGIASGTNNAVARVAGLLAIALAGIAVTASFDRSLDRRLAATGVAEGARLLPPAERARLGAARVPPDVPEPAARRVRAAIAASVVAAFRVVALGCAALALLASAGAALLLGPRGVRARFPRKGLLGKSGAGDLQRPAARQASRKFGESLARLSPRSRRIHARRPSALQRTAAASIDTRAAPAPIPPAKTLKVFISRSFRYVI